MEELCLIHDACNHPRILIESFHCLVIDENSLQMAYDLKTKLAQVLLNLKLSLDCNKCCKLKCASAVADPHRDKRG
ncbi:hypothetical protein GBA52_002638 [Prunus armeniaca]|nr:hypothetical protein GBA52_002638 [Prunus armeniaca]